jgi:glycosyltransferase 2 family protein
MGQRRSTKKAFRTIAGPFVRRLSQQNGSFAARIIRDWDDRAENLPRMMSAIARAIRERVGWKWIGIAFRLLIVAVSVTTLVRLLADIELDRVVAAISAKSAKSVLIAGFFVVIGYITLTFYDFFALRTIGRNTVPYRIAALASFTSYTIGHNIGATTFSAGVIRFRIYSRWGLTVLDVAKIGFVTGLTFWLGNGFVLGASMACAPEAASAVDQLPAWANRWLGLSALTLIGGYLLWLMPRARAIGRENWRIALPSWRLTLVQIGIGVLDLGCGASAMYALLPHYPALDFVALLVIFVTAMLLGFLSHAPGSLGVMEAAMLIGLQQFQKEELLAALLLFRTMYFVLPLFLAASLLAARESWLMGKQAIRRRDQGL